MSTLEASRILCPRIFFRPSPIGDLEFVHRVVVDACPCRNKLDVANLLMRVPVRLWFASRIADLFHAYCGL